MSASEWLEASISREYANAELGDPRRSRRLAEIGGRLAEDPALSFPDAFAAPAELEAFYRFLRNDHVTWEAVLEPHFEATCSRATELGECLVIHDTTELTFKGERNGLGRTSSNEQGFFAHLSLLVAADAVRTPLGVAALEQYARSKQRGPSRVSTRRDDPKSEGRRWLRNAEAVEKRSKGRFSCIHVADREGDTFPFLAGLLDLETRFVVRVAQDRNLEDEDGEKVRLHEQLLSMTPQTALDIDISKRGKRLNPTMARTHPSRNARKARVSIAATSVMVSVPTQRLSASSIEMNLVRVWETRPPDGEPPVEWILWTTEPTRTLKDIRRVVDIYRARWVIEEYFKTLKTGCSFERRQLESFSTLTTALAILAPVAWRLLLMRSIARSHPECAPTEILNPIQVKYLEKKYRKVLRNADEALRAIARLGGHLKQNGEPGWQTLWRGYKKLLAGEAFLRVLNSPETCDQS